MGGSDITSEFFKIAKQTPVNSVPRSNTKIVQSSFSRAALDVAKRIASADADLKELTKYIKQRGVFRDTSRKINILMSRVGDHMASINDKLDTLEADLGVARASAKTTSEQQNQHADCVLKRLKSAFVVKGEEFRMVLQNSSKNQSKNKERERLFGGSAKRVISKPLRLNKEWNVTTDPDVSEPMATASTNANGDTIITMPAEQLQATEQIENNYYQNRAKEAKEITRELGQFAKIFEKIQNLIEEQGESLARIDDNVAHSKHDMEQGEKELRDHLENSAGNKWLAVKVFTALVTFSVGFVTFFV